MQRDFAGLALNVLSDPMRFSAFHIFSIASFFLDSYRLLHVSLFLSSNQLLQVTLSDVMEVSDQPSAQRALMNRKDSASSQPKTMFSFRVEGADRPGIVKEVTAVLAQHQVNCERLESNTKKPPMPKKNANGGSGSGGADASEPAGSAVFVLTGDAESSPGTVRV
jgi:hypothetical protein